MWKAYLANPDSLVEDDAGNLQQPAWPALCTSFRVRCIREIKAAVTCRSTPVPGRSSMRLLSWSENLHSRAPHSNKSEPGGTSSDNSYIYTIVTIVMQ